MSKWGSALLIVATLAAGCGSTSRAPTTSPGPSTTSPRIPVSPTPTTLTVFRANGGELRPEVERVPHTTAVAAAALGALGHAAPVIIANGTARVQIDRAAPAAIAEIVYTLTQFPSVKRVDIAGRAGLTRDDFAAYLPVILVESPAAGAEVHAAFAVRGSAAVFEATLVVELVVGGKVVERQTTTASEGAPARGTFEATLHARSPGAATVRAFAPSAEDGRPQHQVDVPVIVTP